MKRTMFKIQKSFSVFFGMIDDKVIRRIIHQRKEFVGFIDNAVFECAPSMSGRFMSVMIVKKLDSSSE